MRHAKLGSVLLTAALLGMICPTLHAAEKTATTLPALDEVRAELEAKDYTGVVRTTTRLAALRGKAAEGLDRFEMFRLKAEGHFGARQTPQATASLESAVKETTDPKLIATARMTEMLFRKASGLTYQPKVTAAGATSRPAPIDLLDLSRRSEAFSALLEDELSALAPKLKTAKTSPSLLQVIPVLQQVQDLHSLDLVANGNDQRTTEIVTGLTDHARTLITAELKKDWQRVDDISKAANQTTNVMVNVPTGLGNQYAQQSVAHRAGLSSDQTTQLKNIIETCKKIQSVLSMFTSSSDADKDWTAVASDADRVQKRAEDVLSADYRDLSTPGVNTPIR